MSWQFSASFQLGGSGSWEYELVLGEGQSREFKAHWAKQEKQVRKESPNPSNDAARVPTLSDSQHLLLTVRENALMVTSKGQK